MILLDIPEPKNCNNCLFCDYEQGFCYLSTTDGTLETIKSVIEHSNNYTKPDWCPASKKLEKIYVITSGSYSDYSIHGVAVSKERASLLQRYYSSGWNGDARIEEYNLNEPHENIDDLIPVYHVQIKRDGKCFCTQSTWMHELTGKIIEDDYHDESDLGSCLNTKDEHGNLKYHLTDYLTFDWLGPAKDEEHALKIAQDERAKLLEKYYFDRKEKGN